MRLVADTSALLALAACDQLGADVLLADDARVRKVARLNGIAVVGSLGVLLSAKARGALPLIAPALDAMRAAGIHLSQALIAEALHLSGEA